MTISLKFQLQSPLHLDEVIDSFDKANLILLCSIGVRRKKSRGFKVMAGLVGGGGPGTEPPDAGEFSKIRKKTPYENCRNAAFSPILQRNSKPCVNLS